MSLITSHQSPDHQSPHHQSPSRPPTSQQRSSARRWGGRLALLTGCSMGLVAVAQPAMAVAWRSSSSPLTAYHDSASSGTKQAQAYGNYYNSGGTHARNSSQQRDSRPGGNSVYVETRFQFYYSSGGHASQWHVKSNGQTDRTTSSSWVSDYTRTTLHQVASTSRGQIHVCEDQNNAPDDCSVWAYATFSY